MAETTFTFRVEEELKSAFADVAKAHDRTAAQLLRVLMREAVQRQRDRKDHEAWFRSEVAQALREADDPTVRRISNEQVRTDWRQQRAELLKGATGHRHED